MLKRIAKELEQSAQRRGAYGRCPRCESREIASKGEVRYCESCGFTGAPMEFGSMGTGIPPGQVGEPPEGSSITKNPLPNGGLAFEIPASRKLNFLIFFGLLWVGFILLFTVLLFFGDLKSSDTGEPLHKGFALVFFIPFWAVGLGVLYFGLSAAYSNHLLLIERDTVVLVRSLFSFKRTRSLPFSDIKSVDNTVFYTQNNKPVYGVEVKGNKAKIRFGATLSKEEKGWLVAELNHALAPPEPKSTAMSLEMPVGIRQDRFELELAPQRENSTRFSYLLGPLMGLCLSGGFIALGLSPVMEDAGSFRYLWIVFNSLFLIATLVGTFFMIRAAKTRLKVISDGENLHLVSLRSGREVKRERVPLDAIKRISYQQSGSSNNTPCFAAHVVTEERLHRLFLWRTSGSATDFVKELRLKLGCPE
ncbi:MAG: hypothetical protein Q7Q71_00995 [Verrucomicrobiota bacterium JB023]|nr:hypothetical protein [Verrucomicrobiota bacterium JB023]